MINIKKLVENIQKIYPKEALLEYSLAKLYNLSDDKRKERSVGITLKFLGVDQGQHGHARTFWEVNSGTTKGKKYNCVVEFHVPVEGGLFAIAKKKWDMKKFHSILAKSDVKVHCNCPDFYWSGMKYNLGPSGKLKGSLSPNQNAGYEGEPNVVGKKLKPKIRDPHEVHVLCKHLLALKKTLGWYAVDFMSAIRKYDNKIKINDEMAKKLDEGKRALGKDVELVEVSDQDSKEIIDQIVHTPEGKELEKNQENKGSEEIIEKETKEKTAEVPKEVVLPEEPILPKEEEKEVEPIEEISVEEPETTTIEEKKEDGAEDIINKQNEVVKEPEETLEVEPKENEKVILEKNKKGKDSKIPDPNEILT